MNTYNKIQEYTSKNTFPWINTLVRKEGFPVDKYSIYNHLSDAINYALSSVAAYEGQILAVKEDGKQIVYVLDSSDDVSSTGLRRVGVLSANELCGINDYIKFGNVSGKLALSSIQDISSGFGNKVFINNPGTQISGVETDLSVIKIPIDQFIPIAQGGTLQDNILYVVSSDYIEAYGQQLCNLTMNNDDDPERSFLGVGATDTYVNNKLKDIKTQPELSSFFNDDVEQTDLQQVVGVVKYILSSFGVR